MLLDVPTSPLPIVDREFNGERLDQSLDEDYRFSRIVDFLEQQLIGFFLFASYLQLTFISIFNI